MNQSSTITVIDVSRFSYAERVCIAAVQGLVNRTSPSIYLDYGIYDDPTARRTNENFMDDDIWYAKYRDLLGNQDQRNLDYYQKKFNLNILTVSILEELITQHLDMFSGMVVWDDKLPDTVNIALMMAAQQNLLPVTAKLAESLQKTGLVIKEDLRNRWTERVSISMGF